MTGAISIPFKVLSCFLFDFRSPSKCKVATPENKLPTYLPSTCHHVKVQQQVVLVRRNRNDFLLQQVAGTLAIPDDGAKHAQNNCL